MSSGAVIKAMTCSSPSGVMFSEISASPRNRFSISLCGCDFLSCSSMEIFAGTLLRSPRKFLPCLDHNGPFRLFLAGSWL